MATMSARVRSDRAPLPPHGEKAPPPDRGANREGKGPDGFEAPRKKSALQFGERPSAPPPRGRILDPHLIPLVPPGVTTDPARQFHALLGLPPQVRRAEAKAAPPPVEDLETLIAKLPGPRAKLIRDVLSGLDTPAKSRLEGLIGHADFQRLDETEKRRALGKIDLRAR